MKNQVNNSQSTAAVNSAVVNFSSNSSYSNKIEIPVRGFSRDSIITWVGEAVEVERKDVRFCGWIEGGKSIEVHLTKDYFSKNYNVDYTIFDDGKVNMEKSGSIDLDFKVLKGTNINKAVWAITRALEELPYYFVTSIDSNEIEAIEDAEISEAPSLDEAPMLEEDDITEDGYSVAGLVYVRENLWDVEIVPMLKESMGNLFNDPYTMENIMRGGVLDQEKFADALWDIVWEEHLCGLTDEALEAETRYYTDFDALCLQICGAVAAYDEVMRVVKEKSDSTCGAQGFSWDLFSEETMLTLFDNDSLVEQIRDALFDSVGCSDILLYDDCLYLWYDNDSYKAYIVAA